MNLEKMRHQVGRAQQHAEQAERRRWLATLTPEHRAMHERPNSLGVCGACISETGRRLSETVGALSQRIAQRRAALDATRGISEQDGQL